jgi:hypothetical protein
MNLSLRQTAILVALAFVLLVGLIGWTMSMAKAAAGQHTPIVHTGHVLADGTRRAADNPASRRVPPRSIVWREFTKPDIRAMQRLPGRSAARRLPARGACQAKFASDQRNSTQSGQAPE